MSESVRLASERLVRWIEQEHFKGWDPYDALNSPLLKRLTFGNRRIGQAWVQLFKHSPINLRPLLGVPKDYNPKGMGLFLASYWRKYLLIGQAQYLERVCFFTDWLRAHASPGYHGACWGYNFDWPNRGFFAPARMPTIVNTAFNRLAFIDLIALPVPQGLKRWAGDALRIARSACEFIIRDLHIMRPAEDELCFSYTPLDTRYVHNANVLGAWLLAEVAARTSEPDLAQAALAAARYTARRQRPDNAWPYGEGAQDGWIDSFHTGYVLVALKRIGMVLNTSEFENAIRRGYEFWQANFFERDGTPKYYVERIFPVDIHSAAQAILTFLAFSSVDLS